MKEALTQDVEVRISKQCKVYDRLDLLHNLWETAHVHTYIGI